MSIARYGRLGLKYVTGHKPQGVGLILTRRCNIDCSYCKIKDNSRKDDELSVEQWKGIIDKFVSNKHMHFIFTGGEPLLYEGVYELIDHASRNSVTSLITNTSLLDDESFSKLRNLDFLTFSCDTYKKSDNLSKHTTDKFKMIAENCKKQRIKPSVIITVTSKNTKEVPMMIREASRYGISSLLSLIHSDKGDFDFRGYAPFLEFRTEEEINKLKELQRRILNMKRRGYKISEDDYFIENMINYAKKDFQIECPATDPFFTIDCDGRIKPCHDIKASDVNALEFTDYSSMKEKVANVVPNKCNCYYDCYVNNASSKIQLLKRSLRR